MFAATHSKMNKNQILKKRLLFSPDKLDHLFYVNWKSEILVSLPVEVLANSGHGPKRGHVVVGSKYVPKMDPWYMEPKTKTCGSTFGSKRFGHSHKRGLLGCEAGRPVGQKPGSRTPKAGRRVAVAQTTGIPKWVARSVGGNMGQNLRNPSRLILSHCFPAAGPLVNPREPVQRPQKARHGLASAAFSPRDALALRFRVSPGEPKGRQKEARA